MIFTWADLQDLNDLHVVKYMFPQYIRIVSQRCHACTYSDLIRYVWRVHVSIWILTI